jgi:hypothetical protein
VRKLRKGDAKDNKALLTLFGRAFIEEKSYTIVTKIINPGRAADRMNSREWTDCIGIRVKGCYAEMLQLT